jgi:hypothetical protein
MGSNCRMNGLESPFEGAAAISLRFFQQKVLVEGRPTFCFSHQNLTNKACAGGR